jgi:hypothetical protein
MNAELKPSSETTERDVVIFRERRGSESFALVMVGEVQDCFGSDRRLLPGAFACGTSAAEKSEGNAVTSYRWHNRRGIAAACAFCCGSNLDGTLGGAARIPSKQGRLGQPKVPPPQRPMRAEGRVKSGGRYRRRGMSGPPQPADIVRARALFGSGPESVPRI